MSGKGGSSLGTLLFSVPLAAIPLMAIFGIPQFAPLVASPERTRGYSEQEDAPAFERRRPGDERYNDEHGHELDEEADPDASFGGRPNRASPDRRSARDLRQTTPEDNSAWPPQSQDAYPDAETQQSPREFARPSDPLAGGTPIGEQVASGLTWQTAAQRFEELGISGYHLEPGSNLGTFLFVCSFCTAENPNVTMRFESESPEPLDAVSDVLAQIDNWQARQPAP